MSFPSGTTTIIVTPWLSFFSYFNDSILAINEGFGRIEAVTSTSCVYGPF